MCCNGSIVLGLSTGFLGLFCLSNVTQVNIDVETIVQIYGAMNIQIELCHQYSLIASDYCINSAVVISHYQPKLCSLFNISLVQFFHLPSPASLHS